MIGTAVLKTDQWLVRKFVWGLTFLSSQDPYGLSLEQYFSKCVHWNPVSVMVDDVS